LTEIAESRFSSFWQQLDKGQFIKWLVYSLLLINWGFYAVEEFTMASHTLRQGGTFLEWTEAFATTIDEFAWFGLLFMLELETYTLDESMDKPWVKWGVHGLRLVCYVFLAHTVFARVTALQSVYEAPLDPAVTHLCQVADQEVSYGENYDYVLITPDNCDALTDDTVFYMLEPSVITDRDGLALEKKHVWVDFVDAVTWLLVIWAIELAVWLQNRNIAGGPAMLASHAAKAGYAVLFGNAAFWAWTGNWVWAWDQFLWIAGFWAIENNLSEWRDEIREEAT
jgi:hypothetical protein